MTYHIEVLGPTLVRIYEDVVSYPMTKSHSWRVFTQRLI
jgi:hypothetical protein